MQTCTWMCRFNFCIHIRRFVTFTHKCTTHDFPLSVHVRMHVHMQTHMNMGTYACLPTRMYVYMPVYECVYMPVYECVYMPVHVCIHARICMCMYTCVHWPPNRIVDTDTCIHMHGYRHTLLVCMYTHTQACIYTHIQTGLCCVHTHAYTCMYTCIHTMACIHTHTYTRVLQQFKQKKVRRPGIPSLARRPSTSESMIICMYMYTYMYMYIYVYMYTGVVFRPSHGVPLQVSL